MTDEVQEIFPSNNTVKSKLKKCFLFHNEMLNVFPKIAELAGSLVFFRPWYTKL